MAKSKESLSLDNEIELHGVVIRKMPNGLVYRQCGRGIFSALGPSSQIILARANLAKTQKDNVYAYIYK